MKENPVYSFWEQATYFPAFDYLIIGGGFTGLSAGITLLKNQPRARVAILEQNVIGTVASSKNAGFMCYGSPSELLADSHKFGHQAVIDLLRKKQKGINILLSYVGKRKIAFKKVSGHELFSDAVAPVGIDNQQIDQLNKLFEEAIGLTKYYQPLEKSPYPFGESIIKFAFEGQINPSLVIFQLTALFRNLGGHFFNGVSVDSFDHGKNEVMIHSAQGQFQGKSLLIATNALTSRLLLSSEIVPQRAQVLVTKPISKLIYNGNFHMDSGYLYFRNIGDRLLLGGARNVAFSEEQTSSLTISDTIQARLEELLSLLLPNSKIEIETRWAGTMGFKSSIPKLDRLAENVWMAAGMNGMGTALGPALGYEAAASMLWQTVPGLKLARLKGKIS